MSKGKILVTDTLFIFNEHVQQLADAGYEVIRVKKADTPEDELIELVKDKVGYILGGVEYVTDNVFEASDTLKAIVFTGTGYQGHIPGWKTGLKRGVKIGNTPYANVHEVAEWGLAATLAMQRDLFSLGPQGQEKFNTITSLPDLIVGIVGLGHIGKKYADMISCIGAKEVLYSSRGKKDCPYQFSDKTELFAKSDIIFVSVGDEAGENYISSSELNEMKKGALLVSISHHGIINEQDLFEAINKNQIRAALDIVHNKEMFKDLSPSSWYASNTSAAYNSYGYLKRSSDMAVSTILNLLDKGEDNNQVK